MNKDNYVWFMTHTIENNQTELYEEQNAITHTSSFTQQSTDAEGNTITETKIVNDVWFKDEIKKKVA